MFLTPGKAAEVRERFGTPCYVYDQASLDAAAQRALAFPNAFGLTVRYAMKANPNAAILRRVQAGSGSPSTGSSIVNRAPWSTPSLCAARLPPIS